MRLSTSSPSRKRASRVASAVDVAVNQEATTVVAAAAIEAGAVAVAEDADVGVVNEAKCRTRTKADNNKQSWVFGISRGKKEKELWPRTSLTVLLLGSV